MRREKAVALEREQGLGDVEQRAWAALALDHVGDGVVLVDPDGLVRVWNRAAEWITGLADSEVLERRIEEVLPGWRDLVPLVPVGERDGAERSRPLPLEIDDGELWLSLSAVESGEGVVYAFRDVTDEQEAAELRSDLVTTVSHEIRTPVAAVYGAARTLLRGGLQEDVRDRLLGILVSESERLAGLVDGILLASAIDAGRLAVARDEVDLAGLVTTAVESSKAAGDVRLELELPAAGAAVVADADRVGQVLANLLENALKYGAAAGDEAVTVRVLPREQTVRVEVCDRGPGIPAGEQERIFEKFHRLDPRLRGGAGGSGLGLYISRELVLRMQGTIGVESAEGEGATFWFELPR